MSSIIPAIVVPIIAILIIIVILVYRRARRNQPSASLNSGVEPFIIERPKLGWDERALVVAQAQKATEQSNNSPISHEYAAPLESKKSTDAWGPGYEIRDNSKVNAAWGAGYHVNAQPNTTAYASSANGYDAIEAPAPRGSAYETKPPVYEKPQLRSWGVNYDHIQSRAPVQNTAYESMPESTL